jgi:hypothetical protein
MSRVRSRDGTPIAFDLTGEAAHLYGPSAGGGLVLRAAAVGLPIGRLAVYDVPYCVTTPT